MSGPIYPASRHDRPHARLYHHDVQHPAWKHLSGNAFKLICTLLAAYRPNKGNSFPVGGRTVAKLINVSEKTGAKLVDELIEKGHLREERKGRNRGMVKTRERVVSLTRFDTETHAGEPGLPVTKWRENMRQELPTERGRKSGFEESDADRIPDDQRENVVPLIRDATRI